MLVLTEDWLYLNTAFSSCVQGEFDRKGPGFLRGIAVTFFITLFREYLCM